MERVGKTVCLDFVNTVNKRPDPTRDGLAQPGGLKAWAETVGLTLPADAEESPDDAIEFREDLYRTFSAIAAGRDPEFALILSWYGKALPHSTLSRQDQRYTLAWPQPATATELLGLVAASAMQLLLEGPVDRIGECPACGWLFLDTSRNGRRRWCSMATCGSRDKANRYYKKAKA